MKKLVFDRGTELELPGLGVFRPGQEVDYDERLAATGYFRTVDRRPKKDEGAEGK